MEDRNYLVIFWVIMVFLMAFGLMFLINKKGEDINNTISFMEKLGTGIVLGKSEKAKEIAFKFKDTIIILNHKEEPYYLLEKGDSVQVIKGKFIKQKHNGQIR